VKWAKQRVGEQSCQGRIEMVPLVVLDRSMILESRDRERRVLVGLVDRETGGMR
jgi:hypothetical protein